MDCQNGAPANDHFQKKISKGTISAKIRRNQAKPAQFTHLPVVQSITTSENVATGTRNSLLLSVRYFFTDG
jgi:hypothetical protein